VVSEQVRETAADDATEDGVTEDGVRDERYLVMVLFFPSLTPMFM